MKLLVVSEFKGGKGSGWHAPPRGTHTGAEHEAVGSGKAGGGAPSRKAGGGAPSRKAVSQGGNITRVDLEYYNVTYGGGLGAERMPSTEDMARSLSRSALMANQLDSYNRSRIVRSGSGVGIGDVVVPGRGVMEGVPMSVRGFGSVERIEPIFGLPAGHVGSYLAQPMYRIGDPAQGNTTGYTFRIPIDEI